VVVIVPLPRTCTVRCRYNVVVFYKHEGCRRGCDRTTTMNLHCKVSVPCSCILQTTAPLVFVEYNYIVPTPHSCRFLGEVRSRPRRPRRVYRIQLHCIDTLQLQVLGSSTITATTAPLVSVGCRYDVVVFYKHEGCRCCVIVPLPRTCSCKVSVQCSCILQT
jgi:hypothetical protein